MNDDMVQVIRDDIKDLRDDIKEQKTMIADLPCGDHESRMAVVETRQANGTADKPQGLSGLLSDWRVVVGLLVLAAGGGSGLTRVIEVLAKVAGK